MSSVAPVLKERRTDPDRHVFHGYFETRVGFSVFCVVHRLLLVGQMIRVLELDLRHERIIPPLPYSGTGISILLHLDV